MEALRVERLSKDFGGIHALREVSFSVETSEKLAIIGPNGAGKTTLFNVLNGQLSPTSGRIYFYGQDITNLPTHSQAHFGISRSFQIANLFLPLTVLENVRLALQGIRSSRYQIFRSMDSYEDINDEAQELLKIWSLWEKRDEPVAEVSHGEQRRLEIALTLASKPKLLLLDEPSAGLTSGEHADIVSVISNLGTGITVLLIAHDMDLVFDVCERIIVLHYGQMIADGQCDEVRVDAKVKEIYLGM